MKPTGRWPDPPPAPLYVMPHTEDGEIATLRAHITTLQGRIEALERAQTRREERDQKIRRAVGQLAAAFGLGPVKS